MHETPLKFLETPPQYTITFEDQNHKQFTVTGSTDTIVDILKEKQGYIVSAYGVAEALRSIIGAFSDDGKLIIDESVSFEGYYYHNCDIQISKIDFDKKHPLRSKEECLSCTQYLEKRSEFQIWNYKGRQIDRRDLLASAIKWMIAAPFNFAIEKGMKYNPDVIIPFSSKSMGIDPAWGSSAFGIVVTQFVDGIVQILHTEEYHRPDYNEMLSTVYGLISKYDIDKVYIDESISYNDIFDAFRLALKFYHFEERTD
jgi:hypothetical protein